MTELSALVPAPPGRKRQRLAADLRALAATLAPGDRLPSVADLERRFGVSTTTVEAAVEVLRREGLIVRRRGAGTYIAPALGKDDGAATRTDRGTLAVFALCSNPFFENCVSHLVREASAVGLSVECRYAGDDLTLPDVLRFEALRPSGFVFVGMTLERMAAALRERGHAVVLIGDPDVDATPGVPTVYADAERAGYLATKRLLDLGHRRIAYAHHMASDEKLHRKRRWRGHERALREAGVAEPDTVIGPDTVAGWMKDAEAIGRYFAAPGAPTGVVTWYDAEAVLLINALRTGGLRVPHDVSVVGYDNLPLGAHFFPPLDTVDLHMDEQARHALALLSLPAPPKAVSATRITPTLICRASCAPPREDPLRGP